MRPRMEGLPMIVDMFCVLVVLLFLVLGLFSGFLKQAVRLAALLGAFLLASPVLGWVRGRLSGVLDVERVPWNMLLPVLAWVAAYFALLLAGLLLLRVLRGAAPAVSGPDRALGGLLGMLKGGLIVYVAVTVVLFFEKPLESISLEASRDLRRSRVAAVVKEGNPLLEWMREVQERVRSIEERLTITREAGAGPVLPTPL